MVNPLGDLCKEADVVSRQALKRQIIKAGPQGRPSTLAVTNHSAPVKMSLGSNHLVTFAGSCLAMLHNEATDTYLI